MAIPRYQKIKQKILDEIEDKPVHTPIASERELAQICNVSRMTVRNAVNELVEEGVLYRNGNKGTFVADRSLMKKNTSKESLLNQEEGSFILIYLNIKEIPEIAEIFKVMPSTQILRVIRLNKKENRPVSVEEFFFIYDRVDQKCLNNLDKLLDVSPYIQNGKMTQKFYPVTVPVKYANLLNLKLETPIIMVESSIVNLDGEVQLLIHTYYNPKEGPIEIVS